MSIAQFPLQTGSLLAAVDLVRRPTGDIVTDIRHMNIGEIEAVATIRARLELLATWMIEAAARLPDQADNFDEGGEQ